jgi:hypothetical protein
MTARLSHLSLSRRIGPADAVARAHLAPGTLAFLASAR